MADRGVAVSHTTMMRWVIRYVPEFEKRWNRFARLSADRDAWTRPTFQFAAAGTTCTRRRQAGQTVDSCCDLTAASPRHRRFFRKHSLCIRAVAQNYPRRHLPSRALCGDCAESIRSDPDLQVLQQRVERTTGVNRRCASMRVQIVLQRVDRLARDRAGSPDSQAPVLVRSGTAPRRSMRTMRGCDGVKRRAA